MGFCDQEAAPRVRLLVAGEHDASEGLATHVRIGLTAPAKHLSCRWLYDEEGSRLFEEICALPEYYPTRAEDEILARHAGEIVADLPVDAALVELGSGSSTKTQNVIRAMLDRRGQLQYVPVDISPTILEDSARLLVERFAGLSVTGVIGEYQDGLGFLRRELEGPRFVLWLGSNIGNFTRPEATRFLRGVRSDLALEDRLLVGIDLRKDRLALEHAYDDAAGVTARFNKNILTRINRELGADFDLDGFNHRAVYHQGDGRVELSLVSNADQTVRISELELEVSFGRGEQIHTEDSYKYSLAEIDGLAEAAGFAVEKRWLDSEERFSVQRLAPLPRD